MWKPKNAQFMFIDQYLEELPKTGLIRFIQKNKDGTSTVSCKLTLKSPPSSLQEK
jgi:hypothetical protein